MRTESNPSQLLQNAVRDKVVPRDPFYHSDAVMRAYDKIISMGFITRSDAYFSIPAHCRLFVEEVSRASGQYWAPGRRGGLHRLFKENPTPIPHLEIEMCIRFGPIESLYGDLYANLRRYELLLWAIVRGVLAKEFGDAEFWNEAGWWKQGIPGEVRRELSGEWGSRDDLETPWHAATFGTMLKVVEKHRNLYSQINRDIDSRQFGSQIREISRIRNSVMHSLSGKRPEESDFETVTKGLVSLVERVHAARDAKSLELVGFPADDLLVLPELLRERLFPESLNSEGYLPS